MASLGQGSWISLHFLSQRVAGFSSPLLMPPWTGLCRPGKSAMDGAFSLVTTWMSCRGDPAGAGQFMACQKGGITGVHFFGDFLCASKESYSPVSNMLCAKSRRRDGRNNATIIERLVDYFARFDVKTLLHINMATGELLFLLVCTDRTPR